MGIKPESFDVIMAFELIEHVDCTQEFFDILRHGGLLMLTSPVPHMDWLCQAFESVGLNQKRTSPHGNLVYFKELKLFQPVEIKIVGGMAQWGTFRKPEVGLTRPESRCGLRPVGGDTEPDYHEEKKEGPVSATQPCAPNGPQLAPT